MVEVVVKLSRNDFVVMNSRLRHWQGLVEIVHYRTAVKVSSGDIDNEVESIYTQDHASPQVWLFLV